SPDPDYRELITAEAVAVPSVRPLGAWRRRSKEVPPDKALPWPYDADRMMIGEKIGLRRRSPQRRAGRAELKAFHGGVAGLDEPKNRKSQLLLVLALTATFFG